MPSPYLNRPLRSLPEAQRDIAAEHARTVRGALNFQLARFKEARERAGNPALRANYDRDLAALSAALNSLQTQPEGTR